MVCQQKPQALLLEKRHCGGWSNRWSMKRCRNERGSFQCAAEIQQSFDAELKERHHEGLTRASVFPLPLFQGGKTHGSSAPTSVHGVSTGGQTTTTTTTTTSLCWPALSLRGLFLFEMFHLNNFPNESLAFTSYFTGGVTIP